MKGAHTDMFTWIANNLAAFLVCLSLAVILGIAVAVIIRDKKKGRSSCGGNCSACGMCCSCHKR